MFTHLIPTNDANLLRVFFSDYAQRHFLRDFRKIYPKKAWQFTEESILQEISRICVSTSDLQRTQQVDELWHNGGCWIFKYDFRVAGTKVSAKASGNRCIVYLNIETCTAEVLMIYDKKCLPKNQGETAFIESILKRECIEYWREVH